MTFGDVARPFLEQLHPIEKWSCSPAPCVNVGCGNSELEFLRLLVGVKRA